MDKDGGNWTKQDIQEWDKRLADVPRERLMTRLKHIGSSFFRFLDRQGEIISKNGLTPYDAPRQEYSGTDIFDPEDPDGEEHAAA